MNHDQLVRDLFERAWEMSAEEQGKFLAGLSEEEKVVEEVRALLDMEREASAFLEAGPDTDSVQVGSSDRAASKSVLQAGETLCGPYRP